MRKHLLGIAIFLSILFPGASYAGNPYTILMDNKMRQAQHELDLAEKKKGVEQDRLLQKNLELMKENLRIMKQNMVKMDKRMEMMAMKYKGEHHRQMASMMESMVQEHIYVLRILHQIVERTALRNRLLIKNAGK